jgi:MinD-like ATPase involved in chromosome partitioning or flagellar assembly
LAEDRQDRTAGAEPVLPDALESQADIASALAPAQRLATAAARFGRVVEEPGAGDPGLSDPGAGGPDQEAVGPAGSSGLPAGVSVLASAMGSGLASAKSPELASTSAFGQSDWASGLATELLLRPRRRAPAPGWRRTVYRASAGLIRMPPAAAEIQRVEQRSRVRTPVASGHHRIAILSMKGGVGKTTITVGLGSMLASLRGDRIIALDVNPDRGTLADKLPLQSHYSIRDLVDECADITRYSDVRRFTSQTATHLEVLASDQDLSTSAAFSEADYSRACAVLERFYSVCLTDCGTGLMHSAMSAVLRMADQVVLVTTGSVDSARSGSATLEWLAARGHDDLVRNAVVVVNAVHRPGRARVDLNLLEQHFAARCRAVTTVPYDAHLAQGAEVELDHLARGTAHAFLRLAATVGEGFAVRRTEPEAIGQPQS